MIGIGPFITIPLLMSALHGPLSMLGWGVALIIAIFDGMVWSELGAAMPGSGGSYRYLREGFERIGLGKLMAFLFIWQFILSGPLEIASGFIGFKEYLGYVWPKMTTLQGNCVIVALGVMTIFLLYRRIGSIGKIAVALWIGTLLTTGAVIVTGAMHFDPAVAFAPSDKTWTFGWGFLWGLGAAARVGVYDYLGYYDICYIGDEVREPGRVIPKSILLSVVGVALIYVAINLSIVGVVPWKEFVPAEQHASAKYVVSIFMERIYGSKVATVFTLMVLWATVGSIFALMLGYSRIPFAAARDGHFFSVFGRLHPTKNFPHISLLVVGGIAIICSFLPLLTVIDALLITRILVQFVGQIAALILLRKYAPQMTRPYRVWLYPLPCLVALVGWVFIFSTANVKLILLGLGTLAAGIAFYFVWSKLLADEERALTFPRQGPEP
ncbi:MAG: APC family permease [Phycisphaerales bacterium]|nr:APC family permease [Phycisphaerales bacterium]